MQLTRKRFAQIAMACAFGAGLSLAVSSPASAYVACNNSGDCWHTEDHVTFPGVSLSFHDDAWRDQHREDKEMRWHDVDNDHDWHHGYWDHGTWHSG